VVSVRDLVRAHLGLDRPERDLDFPCPSRAFEPGIPAGDCDTDGHYVCAECAHARPGALAERMERYDP
jgi:hypothetical protein